MLVSSPRPSTVSRRWPGSTGALETAEDHAAAPKAEEYIGYGLAAFRLDGKPLVAFGATAKQCAFYPMSGTTVEAHQAELAGYDTSKGTIRFPAAKPLPAPLVRKLVKARIAENAAAVEAKKPGASRTDPAVDAFLTDLDHPLKKRSGGPAIILEADPAVREGSSGTPELRTPSGSRRSACSRTRSG